MVERIKQKLKNKQEYQDELYEYLKSELLSSLSQEGKELVNAFRILPSVVRFAKLEDKDMLVEIAMDKIHHLYPTERLRFLKQLYRALYRPKDKKKTKDVLVELEADEIEEV